MRKGPHLARCGPLVVLQTAQDFLAAVFEVDRLPVDFFAVALVAAVLPVLALFAGALVAAALVVVFFAGEADAVLFFAVLRLAGAFVAVLLLAAVLPVVLLLAALFLVAVLLVAVLLAAVALFAVVVFAVVLFEADALVALAFLAAEPLAVVFAVVSFGSFFAPDTTAFSSAPALNLGMNVFLALMRSPVRGLRTMRASRLRLSKEPKPVMPTFSPLATSRVMVSSTDSSACAACLRLPS
jgi:hypothetical protein